MADDKWLAALRAAEESYDPEEARQMRESLPTFDLTDKLAISIPGKADKPQPGTEQED